MAEVDLNDIILYLILIIIYDKRVSLGNHKESFEIISQKLKDHGHKPTLQGLAIVKMLVKSESHSSIENIHARIIIDFPAMSRAAEYINIELINLVG